jgi:hypothetical protein
MCDDDDCVCPSRAATMDTPCVVVCVCVCAAWWVCAGERIGVGLGDCGVGGASAARARARAAAGRAPAHAKKRDESECLCVMQEGFASGRFDRKRVARGARACDISARHFDLPKSAPAGVGLPSIAPASPRAMMRAGSPISKRLARRRWGRRKQRVLCNAREPCALRALPTKY